MLPQSYGVLDEIQYDQRIPSEDLYIKNTMKEENIDRRIDFHGYGLLEAHEKFISEVKKNYNKNKRCLLIITGKGVHKKNQNEQDTNPKLFYGKIKNSIINWIKEDSLKKYILTYQDAGFEHGGDGALFVYLRKKKF